MPHLAVAGDHHILHEVAVAFEGLLGHTVVGLTAVQLPHDHGLVPGGCASCHAWQGQWLGEASWHAWRAWLLLGAKRSFEVLMPAECRHGTAAGGMPTGACSCMWVDHGVVWTELDCAVCLAQHSALQADDSG